MALISFYNAEMRGLTSALCRLETSVFSSPQLLSLVPANWSVKNQWLQTKISFFFKLNNLHYCSLNDTHWLTIMLAYSAPRHSCFLMRLFRSNNRWG